MHRGSLGIETGAHDALYPQVDLRGLEVMLVAQHLDRGTDGVIMLLLGVGHLGCQPLAARTGLERARPSVSQFSAVQQQLGSGKGRGLEAL